MMAAAGRESHRSSERRLLSLKDDAARPRAETTDATDESIAGGGPSELGAAGLAAGVGNVDALLEAGLERPHGRRKGKHPSKAGGKNTSSGARSTATSARVAASGGREGGKSEGTVAGAAGAAAGEEVDEARGVIKSSTRERSQLMYEQHQETQEKLRTLRDERATTGCTFAPQLASKQKGRKSEGETNPDHLYQDFQKQLEKRERLAEEEGKKLSFRPVLPTASSRLAAKVVSSTPVAGQKSAQAKSKATAEAMYKECTFKPNTVGTKAVSDKIIAAKGKQAPVADRLYLSAEAQAAVLKSREEARAAKEMGACTFRPDTSSSSKRSSSGSERHSDSGNFHERLFGLHGEMLMNKQTKREELAARELMKCTFSPALTAKPIATGTAGKSAFACLPFADDESSGGGGGGGSGGRRNEPVHERLYSMRSRPETREAFVDMECTFQPRLTHAFTRGRGKTDGGGGSGGGGEEEEGGQSRLDAMYNKGKLRQTARSQSPRDYTATFLEKDEAKELEHCTFQPNVSSTQNSRFKAGSRGTALFETLYSRRGDYFELRERIRKEEMKGCTFSPELISHKTRLGRSLSPQRQKPVYEELFNEAATQRFARTLSAEHLQAQQCPFKPKLVTRSRGGSPSREKSPTAAAGQAPAGEPQASARASPPGSRRVAAAAPGAGGSDTDSRPPCKMPWDDTIPVSTAVATDAAPISVESGRKVADVPDPSAMPGGAPSAPPTAALVENDTPAPVGNGVGRQSIPAADGDASAATAAAVEGGGVPADKNASSSGGNESSTATPPRPPPPAAELQEDGEEEGEGGGEAVEEYDY